ncbi:MAG: GNAT family N-acetyltransferase [Sulfuricellaceae bacterium]|nr:GNAT family N-acetyltransferase [Sulfuricellaceae bacterium]
MRAWRWRADAGQCEIGPADSRDIPGLVALLGELFGQEADFRPDRDKQTRALRLILSNPERGRLFVLRDGSQVVGMANALITVSTAEGGPVVLLEDVIVSEPYRDSGLGGKLIDHVLEWAEQEGLLRVTLLTDRSNRGALRFYQRQGFRRSSMVVLRRPLAADTDVSGGT